MRIAIVGINYAPEPTGIPVYTTGLAEYLVRNGHDVTVYTGFPYYPHWAKKPGDRRQLFRRETINGVAVRRHYVYVPARPSALKRMAHELSFVISSMVGYLLGPRAELTIIVSPPLFTGIPVGLIARLKRSLTIFHVQDMQPDAAVDLGMLKPGPLTSFFFLLERLTYRLVNQVSTISDAMLQKIAAKGVSRDKLVLFRNWANDDLVSPRNSDTSYRHEWGLEGKFVALYAGNMGVKQGLGSLLEAATELKEQPDVELVIVGDGGEKQTLMRQATDMGLTNVQFRPLQPMDRLGELLATANVTLVPQKEGVKDIVLPSKLCNLLASGRPVVVAASPNTELGKMVSESGCGVLVEPENGHQMAEKIGQLQHAHAMCARMGREGRRYMQARLTGAMILGDFLGKLENLVSPHGVLPVPERRVSARPILEDAVGERGLRPVVWIRAGGEAGIDDRERATGNRRHGERGAARRFG